jgi:predicted phosphodiesterase
MIEVPSSTESIGLCADIHGTYNHVLRMQEQSSGVSHWFCAGDIVDMHKALHYNQPALRVLSRLEIPSVMGNHDYRFKENKLHRLGEEAREYLRQMPFRLDVQFGERGVRLYHATPESRESFALERAGEETFCALFGEEGAGILGDADVVVLGHTHEPYVRDVGGTRFINPGALGLPDEQPPSFCVLSEDGQADILYLDEEAPKE